MPLSPLQLPPDQHHYHHEHHFHMPHIGLWQTLRLFIPELEVHPIFIYSYGMIEIRETSDKTKDYGRMRIMATFVAIGIGLPIMFIVDKVRPLVDVSHHILMEIAVLALGALLVLCVAEWAKCRVYCGLAASIYLILLISHFESSMYLYSVMRAIQTIIGVFIAWVINVKLLPYPPAPGSLSYYLKKLKSKSRQDNTTAQSSTAESASQSPQ